MYYGVVRSILRVRPRLLLRLVRCKFCGILFLTHPCNAGRRRKKLHCPFGCRQEQRRRASTRRSVAYYRTTEGRYKRKIQNGKRRGNGEEPSAGAATRADSERPACILEHVRVVASQIEGRQVGREEILKTLARTMKQRRRYRAMGINYSEGRSHKAPP